MPSKSKGRKRKNSNQQWQVKQPTRNWWDLTSDLMLNILQRVGVVDILKNAQKVQLEYLGRCMLVVDRSQGQLIDLTLACLQRYGVLLYFADRSSQLRRLEIAFYPPDSNNFLSKVLKKLWFLEELSLVRATISQKVIEAAGHYCPMLKTLKVNNKARWFGDVNDADDKSMTILNKIALAIGKNLPELTHLELIGNNMKNIGLQAILDGCCHLESLDLRRCLYIDLNGDLGKRCSQKIKYLKLPHDSLEGYLRTYGILDDDNDNKVEYFGYLRHDL